MMDEPNMLETGSVSAPIRASHVGTRKQHAIMSTDKSSDRQHLTVLEGLILRIVERIIVGWYSGIVAPLDAKVAT
jgi:hypothetical protein